VVDRTALLPQGRGGGGSGHALAFLPGTATVAAADRAILARLATTGRGATFRVTGFADDPGTGRALDLPIARARAVADVLRAAGVAAEAIELGGEARPGPAGRGAEVTLVYSR
jgi:outer membrane protein OmpA-like peptidoglycan-associated protein